MDDQATTLVTLGAIVIAGLIANEVGRRTKLPRVTLLLLVGVAAGPEAFDLLPKESREEWFPVVTNVALVMVGFLLGEQFTTGQVRRFGKAVVVISLGVAVGSAVAVVGGTLAVGAGVSVALLLGAASVATDPAATSEVIRESRAEGNLTRTLLGLVAVDDVWGITLFSLAMAIAGAIEGSGSPMELLGHGAWEIGGAVVIGLVLGWIMARVTGRIEPGEPTRLEALGLVLLTAGLALWVEVSMLLTAVVLGTMVANFAAHHTRPFHEIENIEGPFLAAFFVLAGATLDFEALVDAGIVAAVYVVLRIAGRIAGSYVAATVVGATTATRHWLGPALLPQAGVALGMALVAVERFPELRDEVLPVVVGTTVLFELAGPPLARFAISRAGESGRKSEDRGEESSAAID